MSKKWAPIAAGVLLLLMVVLCVISVAESKHEAACDVTRSMDINHKKLEITAYARSSRMSQDNLSECVDGAISLCQEYAEKYFDEQSDKSELGHIADLQKKGAGGRYELSPSPLLLVRSGLMLTECSGGAYDITAGALYRLFEDPEEAPTEEELREALSLCGSSLIETEDHAIRLKDGVVLNLDSLSDCYMCRMLEEYFILCGVANVCVSYGDVVFTSGGRLTTKGVLFWKHIEKEPFEVILPDAYPDLKEDKLIADDGYYAWAARPEAASANDLYTDILPFVSSQTGLPYEHETGSVAVVLENGAHAWYAHAIAHMLLALGKENSMKLLSSGLLETSFDLSIRQVRFEMISGETEFYKNEE